MPEIIIVTTFIENNPLVNKIAKKVIKDANNGFASFKSYGLILLNL